MKITVFGAGYVGLVTGACLAEMGNHVVCLDVEPARVALLQGGGLPIHEPGLHEIVTRNMAGGRLQFTLDVEHAVGHGTLQFIAVGTPPGEDGSADLCHVLTAAQQIGRHMTDYKVVIGKSTVPVGTGDKVRAAVQAELRRRGLHVDFAVVSNPEFLKEGAAVADFMRPDRVVVGGDDECALLLMRALYAPFVRNRDRMLTMDLRSAEFTKYAANAMLATRISFMNELSHLAERLGADIEAVRLGIGSDPRIGSHFLYAGCGYGGSCFPKDIKALMATACETGTPLSLLREVEAINTRQRLVLADKIVARLSDDLRGLTFALWGLAFKPNTDDMREAPSRTLVAELARRGARVQAYDPVAMQEAQRVLDGTPGLVFCESAHAALCGAQALVIVTEWKEFRTPDFDGIRNALQQPLVFDGRNLYEPELMRSLGFEYHCIGRPCVLPGPAAVMATAYPALQAA
jgi:UDPglucose 6-dehydrogenase